jgi:hypothetical protein
VHAAAARIEHKEEFRQISVEKKACVTFVVLRTPAFEMTQGDVEHRRQHVKMNRRLESAGEGARAQ